MLIKVGILLSYDYEFVKSSLPYIYPHADLIAFAVDKDRISWGGNKYEFDEGILDWIRANDPDGKIRIYEDDFHLATLSPIENDNRQRNLLAKFMGEGGWHIQIDTDEYFPDFKQFTDYLRTQKKYLEHPERNRIDIGAFLIPIFKQTNEGFLYVDNCFESVVLATNYPEYIAARRSINRIIYTPHFLFHQSWARSEKEIWFKLSNWGHVTDFDTESYYQLWRVVDSFNYKFIRDFHPIYPGVWPSLKFGEGRDIGAFISNFMKSGSLFVPRGKVIYKNMAQLIIRFIKKYKNK